MTRSRRDPAGRLRAALCVGSASLTLLFGTAAQSETRFSDIAPILKARCVICHSGESPPLGLRLDSYAHLRAGSTRGPVVIGGDPDASELIRRIRGESQPRMPLTGPPFLTKEEILRVEDWVRAGLLPASAEDSVLTLEQKPVPAPGEPVTYADVAVIFTRRCVKCHTRNGLRGPPPEGLILSSRESILSAQDRVRVVPGFPEASELVRRILGKARPRMPFDGPPYLSQEETRLIVDWIRQGARDASGRAAPLPVGARVRLHGKLTSRWALDGLPLEVDAGTRFDKSPRVGDYVRVRGIVGQDGRVRATRIRRR